jgi:hypothetical protein
MFQSCVFMMTDLVNASSSRTARSRQVGVGAQVGYIGVRLRDGELEYGYSTIDSKRACEV